MTLLDFCRLLKRHIVWVIVVPILCGLVTAGIVMYVLPAQYSAEATIRSSSNVDIASLGGITQSAAQEASEEQGVEITTKTNNTTRSVTVTAESSDAHNVLAALQTTESKAQEEVRSLFSDEAMVSASIPQNAENVSPSPVRYGAAALLAGLFVVICVIVIVDRVRDPIHSVDEVEEVYELEFLGSCLQSAGGSHSKANNKKVAKQAGGAAGGLVKNQTLARETLLANIMFAGNDAQSYAVVPVAAADNGQLVLSELTHAAQAENMTAEFKKAQPNERAFTEFITQSAENDTRAFIVTASVDEGIGASYAAHEADATVLVLNVTRTKHKELRETLHQLTIAQANVVGFVNVPQGQ